MNDVNNYFGEGDRDIGLKLRKLLFVL